MVGAVAVVVRRRVDDSDNLVVDGGRLGKSGGGEVMVEREEERSRGSVAVSSGDKGGAQARGEDRGWRARPRCGGWQ